MNNEQLDDMLKDLNVHCLIRNHCIDSTDEVTKLLLEDINYEIWDICENCSSFANDESLVQFNSGVWKANGFQIAFFYLNLRHKNHDRCFL